MWFKDIFLNDLIPAILNIIPTIFGGLYESISVYDIISVPLVICFLCGVIVIFARAIEYIQEIVGRVKNKKNIKKIGRRK